MRGLFILTATLAAVALAATRVVAAELEAGDQAPPFSLPGSDGKTHDLADYEGRTVILAWFPKAFTGG